ncbi:hypothetical protein PHET_12257, partial [Paragonimus heterotremus]
QCKERQLVKLLEQYLGESDALKKFVSRYVRRKPSGASGRRGKQTSSSSSGQNSGSNYKKEYVPYVVEMQAEASRDSRPNHQPTVSQPWKYDSNVQPKDHDGLTTTSRSLSFRESVLKDITKTGTDKSTRPDAIALSSTLVDLIYSLLLYSDRFRLFANRTIVRGYRCIIFLPLRGTQVYAEHWGLFSVCTTYCDPYKC